MVADPVVQPVLDKSGEIVLYDIWTDGKWIGSRRTKDQVKEAIKYANPEWELWEVLGLT
jgi:hypothetical protein